MYTIIDNDVFLFRISLSIKLRSENVQEANSNYQPI